MNTDTEQFLWLLLAFWPVILGLVVAVVAESYATRGDR